MICSSHDMCASYQQKKSDGMIKSTDWPAPKKTTAILSVFCDCKGNIFDNPMTMVKPHINWIVRKKKYRKNDHIWWEKFHKNAAACSLKVVMFKIHPLKEKSFLTAFHSGIGCQPYIPSSLKQIKTSSA